MAVTYNNSDIQISDILKEEIDIINSEIKFKRLNERAVIPTRGREGDAGFDLYTLEGIIIKAHDTIAIPTGIAIEINKHQEAQVRPRSGITLNGLSNGKFIYKNRLSRWWHNYRNKDELFNNKLNPYIRVLLGTIDSNYRGEVSILAYNQEDYDVYIPSMTKLAQLVVNTINPNNAIEVEELSDSNRGIKGFGSSGVQG